MTTAIKQTLLIASKDLRIESRNRQTLSLVVVLGILIVTVLGLGLGGRVGVEGSPSAVAVLWVAYLFAGVLCFEKTMAVERQDGALAGLMLAPLDRGIIYAAKLLSNLALMFAVAAVITPVGVLFFGFDLSPAPFRFLTIIALSMIGFAAVGTLFAALASSSRLQGGFLAMLVFPVTLPLVIASTQISTRLYDARQPWSGSAFAVLIAFDAIFLVVSWLAFEWVLEP
jgi:heme exporter protein B